jgi:hypothetical protein
MTLPVPCPVCKATVDMDGRSARCPICTVIVNIVEGRVRAGTWAGSDPHRASIWLKRLPASRFERGPVPALLDADPPKCGTRNGYIAHRRRGEDPCPGCRAANAADAMERKLRAREKAA